MTCTEKTDDNCWPPRTYLSHWLSEQTKEWEASEDKHSSHASEIRVHSELIDEISWQITTEDAQYRHYSIKGEDERDGLR